MTRPVNDATHSKQGSTLPFNRRPSWVEGGENYFITLKCQTRKDSTLCCEASGRAILDAARHNHESKLWYVHIMLLMPDHLHALICIPPNSVLLDQIENFKRISSRQTGIKWQKGFFDHRLRSNEPVDEKILYIAMNPVRRKLISKYEEWPWIYKSI